VLVLLKIGFSLHDALAMPVTQAWEWVNTYTELMNPERPSGTKYVVKKKENKGR